MPCWDIRQSFFPLYRLLLAVDQTLGAIALFMLLYSVSSHVPYFGQQQLFSQLSSPEFIVASESPQLSGVGGGQPSLPLLLESK